MQFSLTSRHSPSILLDQTILVNFCKLKVFILTKLELLTPFLISWRNLTECYSKILPTNSATYRLFSCTFYETISIDVSKKVYVILCNIWICSKNAVILHVEITCKIGVCFLALCLFWLTKFSIWQMSATSEFSD